MWRFFYEGNAGKVIGRGVGRVRREDSDLYNKMAESVFLENFLLKWGLWEIYLGMSIKVLLYKRNIYLGFVFEFFGLILDLEGDGGNIMIGIKWFRIFC